MTKIFEKLYNNCTRKYKNYTIPSSRWDNGKFWIKRNSDDRFLFPIFKGNDEVKNQDIIKELLTEYSSFFAEYYRDFSKDLNHYYDLENNEFETLKNLFYNGNNENTIELYLTREKATIQATINTDTCLTLDNARGRQLTIKYVNINSW